MTKVELYKALQESGLFHRIGKHPLWLKAFELYNDAHPEGRLTDLGCGKCFAKVKTWLAS
jgi:hypothetical protein